MTPANINRFDVYQVTLDPTIGSEIAKSRPCVVISPDEMNRRINTVIVAPLTRTIKDWPSRVQSQFDEAKGEVALDQMGAVDKRRLVKRLGQIEASTQNGILLVLARMFAP
ncbi:MAG: type II toxin-antitoxin system PemK/MazF family toxin [Chloroflexi bacterium]|nr:type II toxin-antitoxin system PemK/MazF family toxin [Chloroflexota bacterium]